MNEQPTEKQIGIMRHALGLDRSKYIGRNYFVTGPGSPDYDDCEQLVAMGLMDRHDVEWFVDPCYLVSDKGRLMMEEATQNA